MKPILQPIKLLMFILCMYSGLIHAQNQSKVLLINQKGNTIYTVKEGKSVSIVTLDKYQMTSKHLGILKLINDTILAVGSLHINIDSIYKIGEPSAKRKIMGHTLTGIGVGLIITGGAVMANSYNNSNISAAKSEFILGTLILGIGTSLTIGGQKIANGRLKRVKPYRSLRIQISNSEN